MSEILVTVKTYPEVSKKHRETVCTAGILKETRKLVRLYPIRFRYLKDEQKFSKYQWINVDLERNPTDIRPESYRLINPDIITTTQKVGTEEQWLERCKWVLNEKTVFKSVEELKVHQEKFKTSLGLVKPKGDVKVIIKEKSIEEVEAQQEKQLKAFSQMDLFESNENDLDVIPYRFYLKFKCDDPTCTSHEMSILDWEIAQLYRNLKNENSWQDKIIWNSLD